MKKMLLGAFFGMFALAGIAVLPNMVSASDDPNGEQVQAVPADQDPSLQGGGWDYGKWANPAADENLVWAGQKLTGSAILDTIKNAINWILGILATIALVICLYGWFKMVTAAGDEKKYGEWLKVLKYAAIGLAIIGLSWMIVSVVFWFVGTLSWKNQTKSDWDQTVEASGDGTSLRDSGDSAAVAAY